MINKDLIPKSWNDITIEKWQELVSIKPESDDDMISVDIEQMSILLDAELEEIRNMKLPLFKEYQSLLSFRDKAITPDVVTTFEIEGKEYGIIPKLDMDFISAGEFLDIENWKEDSVKNLHLICALIYRPVISKEDGDYQIEEYKQPGFLKRSELFKINLPITKVYGAVLFFSAFSISYTEIILTYLEDQQKSLNTMKTKTQLTATKKAKQGRSKKNGGGIK